MPSDSVLVACQTKLHDLQLGITQARSTQILSLSALLAAVVLAAYLLELIRERRVQVWSLAVPVPAVVIAGYWYGSNRSHWLTLHRRQGFWIRARTRLEGRWQGQGFSGDEFRVSHHPYERDLQLLGAGSLFELLCTARTGLGRRRLSNYLLDTADATEAVERQQAVRELTAATDLRERIALLGAYEFQESDWSIFADWLNTSPATVNPWIRVIMLAASAITATLALAIFITNIPVSLLLPLVPPFLIIELVIAACFRYRTGRLNDAACRVGAEISVVREGIELISGMKFESGRLRSIQERLRGGAAVARLRLLERLTGALSECDKPWFDWPSRLLVIRTQLCFAIEHWKLQYSIELKQWLDAWAEFEALAAISAYAWEHPDDVFPVFAQGSPSFTASGLGHPLIPVQSCVLNQVTLDARNRFYLVSGSNMSGKSTLLRSIGLNVVLANAGAPVRAASLRLSELRVCASLSVVDSPLEGRSKFFAEVEKSRQTLETARHFPVLFLIDEILNGTNSRERRIVAEAIVRALIERGAIGALSTHDLALTAIAEIEELAGSNVHMGSRSGNNPLEFDYLLKPGVSSETNALAIASLMGVQL